MISLLGWKEIKGRSFPLILDPLPHKARPRTKETNMKTENTDRQKWRSLRCILHPTPLADS
jgi:hypothetical protein